MIDSELQGTGASRFVKLAKLPRLYRILRFIKMIKIFKSSIALQRWYDSIQLSQYSKKITSSFIMMAFLLHLVGCLFAITGNISEGFGYMSWIQAQELDLIPVTERYLASIYWAVVTCATVGYGDITPTNVIEVVVCILLLLIGVTAYSYIVSNIVRLFSNAHGSSVIT